MAIQAKFVSWLPKLSIVLCPMNVVARETGNSASVHHALHEVVPLHPILVRGSVCKMCEGRLAKLVVFELPKILQLQSGLKAHGPIVIFTVNRTREPSRKTQESASSTGSWPLTIADWTLIQDKRIGYQDVVGRGGCKKD